ncbi:serine hydrolase [Parapedobacter sp.]|uniref:serine hydrolase n=1 Tax=Parapedobacter sp. TaxID=1958893 RepID=UPI002D7E91C7|nr:serine hydrolase [Parapedobacter sp.]
MQICRLLMLTVLLTGASLAWAQPTEALRGIDSLLEKLLDDYHVAGFSVAVVHKDSVVYAKGFGYRNYEERLSATPNTLYAIGSSSKAFTAALVGQLFGDSLSLDDKVTRHLPQLHFKDGREGDVTVRDLMTHRTGLSRYDYSWYVFNSDSRDSLLRRVAYMEPSADLRAKWQYNNFMYLAQGMIAERITGKTWEENIKEQFFKPLGMTRSNFDVNEMAADPDASSGYTVDEKDVIKKLPYFEIRGMGPAGSINSSVLEMANWLKLWIDGGKYQGKRLIPVDFVKEAASSQMVIAGGLPTKYKDVYLANYGLGWMISSYRGHYLVEHGGNIDGFSASTCFFPTERLGIVVLSNQNVSAVPAIVRNLIADRWFGLSFVDWNDRGVEKDTAAVDTAKQEDLARIKGTQPTHGLPGYTGTYENAAYGAFAVNVANDTLKITLGKQRVWLSHYHYDVFEMKDIDTDGKADTTAGGLKINFRTGLDGQVESASITMDDPSGNPVEFKRQPMTTEVSQAQLQAYVGKYSVGGMTITITVKDGVLFMDVPGQTNYETLAQGDHYFKLKALNGFAIRFEMDEQSGKASAMYAIQPNGTFKAIRLNE